MDDLLMAIRGAGIAARCFAANEVEELPGGAGAYALLMRLDHPLDIGLRKSKPFRLLPGCYVYAGSAMGAGGMRGRLRRHFRRDKAPHWHADRLTNAAGETAALPLSDDSECGIIDRLLRSPSFDIAVRGFGNSDCSMCETHLLRFAERGLQA